MRKVKFTGEFLVDEEVCQRNLNDFFHVIGRELSHGTFWMLRYEDSVLKRAGTRRQVLSERKDLHGDCEISMESVLVTEGRWSVAEPLRREAGAEPLLK